VAVLAAELIAGSAFNAAKEVVAGGARTRVFSYVLLGAAGTGKTTAIRKIVEEVSACGAVAGRVYESYTHALRPCKIKQYDGGEGIVKVAVTASTGAAAALLPEGMTLHSFLKAGIGVRSGTDLLMH
jgi:molybdopterin-guanine dinucleotide biosynthesis protein